MKDATGLKVGRITFEKPTNIRKSGSILWQCRCDCGEIIYKTTANIKNLKFLYGCKKCQDSKTDVSQDRKLYRVWASMKKRCGNKKDKFYGARGIKVCDEWRNDFFCFRDWAYKNGYDKTAKKYECTIDRIDNNGNYEPSNCRWISLKEQNYNKRSNHFITINGKTQCATLWLKELNVNKNLYFKRIQRGWDDIEALTKPSMKIKNNASSS